MPPTTFTSSPADASLTITIDLPTDLSTAWNLWADPRLLERWWGPPEHPCTFTTHEFHANGQATYYMDSPSGQRYHGWWRVIDVAPQQHISLIDGFGESFENPADEMPISTTTVTFTPNSEGTRILLTSTYESPEELQRALDLGMEEGFITAIAQIDALIA